MGDRGKISLIIPAYNVEEYFERLKNSVLEQTYTNLQIILVDDGSNDNTSRLLDAWMAEDDRVEVIHKKNGGLSSARNAGMMSISGEYVFFMDADDCMHSCTLEILMEKLIKYNADVVACGYQNFSDIIPNSIDSGTGKIFEFNNAQALECLILRKGISVFVWGKLYKKELALNMVFPEGKLSEDLAVMPQLLARSQKVILLDLPLYYYFKRNDSICGQASEKLLTDNLYYLNEFKLYVSKMFPELIDQMDADYMRCHISIYNISRFANIDRVIITELRGYRLNFIRNRYLSYKMKSLLMLFFVWPPLERFIVKKVKG